MNIIIKIKFDCYLHVSPSTLMYACMRHLCIMRIMFLHLFSQISCTAIPGSSLSAMDQDIRPHHNRHQKVNTRNQTQSQRTRNTSSSSNRNADSDNYFGIFSIKSPCSDKYVVIIDELISASATNQHEDAGRLRFQDISTSALYCFTYPGQS